MPTYAVLGATGATGGNILKLLIKDPSAPTINVYVRSKSKLLQQIPSVADLPNVKIFTGNLSDTALIASCLENADAVFSTVASNDNMPGTHIAQDTAQSIVVALMDLRMTKPGVKLPTIVWLSSASVNPFYYKQGPALLHWVLMNSFSYVYTDLMHAETYLKMHQKWLKAVFIQPGGLVEDKQRGHAVSTEKTQTFLSYADLAAGMIEVAEKGGYDWQGVSVIPTTKDTKIEYAVPGRMVKGLTFHFFPWTYFLTKKLHLH
ncbi:MAG: hypothetical protein LQ350_001720 [Teloschistes chrysophthalmus]|nr:MAG: hypothetical protein LQ350_001720 [Niorma chrysophthalma]